MKKITRLPLYLGLGIFVVTVLLSAVKLGEKKSITATKSRAGSSISSLNMRFVAPDMINVSFVSEKPVSGIDAVMEYEKDKISILPSTLSSGQSFITTGGTVNEEAGTFSFSALSKEAGVKAGMVGTFKVARKDPAVTTATRLKFKIGEEDSKVIEEATGNDILGDAEGVEFSL